MDHALSTRRGFLKRLGVGAATLTLASFRSGYAQSNDDTFTCVVSSGPTSFEPTLNNEPNLQVVANIYDGLLSRDISGRLQPALATSWERTEDRDGNEEWVFDLRERVEFHNGRAFSAEDVRFTFERLREDFSEFQTFGNLIKDVVFENAFRVRVLTEGSVPFFADNLHQIFILNMETDRNRTQEEIATNPNGTGAYLLQQWLPDEGQVVLEANDNYWNNEASLKEVVHQELSNGFSRIASLENGGAQLVQNIPVESASRIRNSGFLSLDVREGRQCIFFSPKMVGTPFERLKVRQAVYHAINEQRIIDDVMRGFATAAAQVPDSPTVGFNGEIQRVDFDPDRARLLLADAGFPNGFNLTIDVTNDQFVNAVGIADAVSLNLEQVGINATVRARPSDEFFADLDQNLLDFFIVGWFDGAYDFGRTAENLLVTGAPFNGSLYSNRDLDALIDVSKILDIADQRDAILRQANNLVMTDVALFPLHYESQVWGRSRDLRFTPRADGWTIYREMGF